VGIVGPNEIHSQLGKVARAHCSFPPLPWASLDPEAVGNARGPRYSSNLRKTSAIGTHQADRMRVPLGIVNSLTCNLHDQHAARCRARLSHRGAVKISIADSLPEGLTASRPDRARPPSLGLCRNTRQSSRLPFSAAIVLHLEEHAPETVDAVDELTRRLGTE
jgi:hypothetical protein